MSPANHATRDNAFLWKIAYQRDDRIIMVIPFVLSSYTNEQGVKIDKTEKYTLFVDRKLHSAQKNCRSGH